MATVQPDIPTLPRPGGVRPLDLDGSPRRFSSAAGEVHPGPCWLGEHTDTQGWVGRIDLAGLVINLNEALIKAAPYPARSLLDLPTLAELALLLGSQNAFALHQCDVQSMEWAPNVLGGYRKVEFFLEWDERLFGIRGEETPRQAMLAIMSYARPETDPVWPRVTWRTPQLPSGLLAQGAAGHADIIRACFEHERARLAGIALHDGTDRAKGGAGKISRL